MRKFGIYHGCLGAVVREADASDSIATSNAIAALNELVRSALNHDLKGSAIVAAGGTNAIYLIIHRRYNPEGITQ